MATRTEQKDEYNLIKQVDELSVTADNSAETCEQSQRRAFNHAPQTYHEDKIVSQLFEDTVQHFADRPAISFANDVISYAELNAKANQLANYLRKCGIGRNALVAIYLERSIEFIVSILAVIKAGGCFLPLSTEDPNNRIRRILQDSSSAKIITTADLHQTIVCALSPHSEKNTLIINRFFDENIERDNSNPPNENTPADPLYVMYTSGSTGNPKGCMVSHHSVTRLAKETNYIQIDETDRIAQVSNAAFDVLNFEMWGALLNGACLHIIPQITLLSPVSFARALKQNDISILSLTPSLLNLIVKSCPTAFDHLKYLLFAGEKANPEIIKILLARKLKNNLPLVLINAYGPTECTTFATTYVVQDMSDIEKNVPIGMPITDTTAYVFDENMQFVPAGVLGELHLGGKGVALGYLNDAKKTAQKFISNPLKPEETIYKTGDLVYWQPDVGIVYVGREDEQVKINGFRVEPSEIEAMIVKKREVKQAAVITHVNKEGRKSLIAYVCFNQKAKVDFANFHQYLKDNIPHYMMPSKTICVDSLPLTLTGKIDKVALQQSVGKNILESNVHNIPSNQIEKILSDVWQQLLSITSIMASQNFFDLGAHSLMLNEACTLINSKLINAGISKEISIMDILTYPSIKQLADFIIDREKNKESVFSASIERGLHKRRMVIARKSLYALQ